MIEFKVGDKVRFTEKLRKEKKFNPAIFTVVDFDGNDWLIVKWGNMPKDMTKGRVLREEVVMFNKRVNITDILNKSVK